MKAIKTLAMLFIAATITLGVNAQGTSTGAKGTTGAKASTGTKTTTTSTTKTTTATPAKTSTPPADVKSTDKPDATMKGPKGGKYYINASGKKTYLKQEAK